MYIHSFQLISSRKLSDAQLFNRQYRSCADIPDVPGRLRRCRYRMGLTQKEVAERIGITGGRYRDYEAGSVDRYPKEIVDKLSELYGVPADDLLDDYNRFLYRGQGKLIREHRERLSLERRPFARSLNVEPSLLRLWESEEKIMYKKTWEKYFRDIIKV